MSKFIESFDEYKGSLKLEEASEIAEFNEKIKRMGEEAKEAREKATDAKDAYEQHVKKGEHAEAKIEMLRHTKFKSQAAMLNASVDLLLIEHGKEPKKEDKKEDKPEEKKDKE